MKLTENLRKIDEAVKSLGADAKMAAKQTASINTQLKFDSSNVTLVAERFEALKRELDANNKRLKGLEQAQEDLNKEREKEKGDTEESKRNLAEIEKLAAQYANQIEKATANQYRLNEALDQQNKNEQLINAATQQITTKYNTWIQLSEKVSQVTERIYQKLKQVVSESTKLGVELYSVSKRYGIEAEEIQKWDRALQVATGQSNLYSRSLKELVKTFAEVASGRGIATKNVLKDIGLSYEELAEMSLEEQFSAIVEALRNVENASLRANYAEKLFKEAGQDIAGVFGEGALALEEYYEKAKEYGIVSNETVDALKEESDALEILNSHLDTSKAEIAGALLPLVESLADLVKNVLAPALKFVANGLAGWGKGGQIVIAVIGVIVFILPKVITLMSNLAIAQLAASAGATKLSVAMNVLSKSMGWISAIIGVISLIAMLVGAFKSSANAANEASDAMQNYGNIAKGLEAQGIETTSNTEQYATSNKEYYMQADVNIHGEGDTPIGDENAIKVAQYTADALNKSLGELVK